MGLIDDVGELGKFVLDAFIVVLFGIAMIPSLNVATGALHDSFVNSSTGSPPADWLKAHLTILLPTTAGILLTALIVYVEGNR